MVNYNCNFKVKGLVKMKIFKSFSIILVFSLLMFALSNLGLSFVEASAETNSQSSVIVYQNNASQVFSAPWNYSSITLGADIDMTSLTLMAVDSSVAQAFSGTFDGNGFSISNITFSNINTFDNSSTGSIMGLIPFAKSATIKNVKITGYVNYSLSDKNYSELNMGILVGKGIDVNISNCEINIKDENINQIEIYNSSANFGCIAGKLESSQIYDVVITSPIKVFIHNNLQYNIGAVVGATTSSSIQRVLFYGDINLEGEGSFDNAYVGGLVGFAQGECNIKDNCVSSITNSTVFTKGALIGAVSANNALPAYYVNYCYWTDSSLNVVGENGDRFNITETLKPVSAISYSFLNNSSNFNPVETGLDFKKTFGIENGQIVLQKFQKFYFSCDKNLDNIVESVNFSNGETGTTISDIDYGEDITISIKLKSQNKSGIQISNVVKFYEISDIRVNGVSKNVSDYTISANESANSFTIKFDANGYTSGEYSFAFNPKPYRGEFTIQKDGDNIVGGVTFSKTNPVENILQSYTIQSVKTNISAIAQNYFVFDHWNLYYLVDGQWQVQSSWNGSSSVVNSTIATLPINFGVAPFDQSFKLEAVFSDENGVAVNFVNLDKSQIDNITLQGISFEEKPITVLNTLTNASVIVTTNKGYQLDVDKFLSVLEELYQENVSKEEVLKSTTINEDGQTVYTLSVNINKINENSTGNINISIPTKIADSDDSQNLLWLWITLPCVIVVLAVSITLIIYFKKRNQAKNNVKKKEKVKEINYKDFYS